MKNTALSAYSAAQPALQTNSNARSATGSGVITFNDPLAADPNIITGAINFNANQTQEVEIDGVTYTLKNRASKTSQVSFSKNLTTGELTFVASNFDIKGQTDVAHNLVIDGTMNDIYTGDLDDIVRDVYRTTNKHNKYYLGAGDDNAVFTNDYVTVYGDDGDDYIEGAMMCTAATVMTQLSAVRLYGAEKAIIQSKITAKIL